eukprot:746641-Hanusia_phi.AAC.3
MPSASLTRHVDEATKSAHARFLLLRESLEASSCRDVGCVYHGLAVALQRSTDLFEVLEDGVGVAMPGAGEDQKLQSPFPSTSSSREAIERVDEVEGFGAIVRKLSRLEIIEGDLALCLGVHFLDLLLRLPQHLRAYVRAVELAT